jgi:NADH-quinone oxidoreductase subunit D
MAYLLPIGPFHPALDEPVAYKLEVTGTKIDSVEIELGFNHRGVEATLPNLLPQQVLAPISRLCGKCSYANTLVATLALEKLAGIEPPPRASYFRTIAAELERAASHLGSTARTLRLLGLNLSAARLESETEGLRQLLAATGNRIYDTFTLPGGAMRAPYLTPDFLNAIEKLRKNIYESVNSLLDNRQLQRRTIGIGVINTAEINSYGMVGTIARASDSTEDWRKTEAYAAYSDLDFRVINQRRGDLFSRLAVRLLESLESLNIVMQALRHLPEGTLNDSLMPPVFETCSEATAIVESPRGLLVCYVNADEQGRLGRLKLNPPTLANLPALPLALTGQQADDAPALLASLDNCFACAER